MIGSRRNRESGQILIVVATAFVFVLLTAASLTIDVGNGMLQQRRLQNITDSAALAAAAVLADGGQTADAITAAQAIVSNSTNGALTLPGTYDAPGTGLTSGIHITFGEVRVALKRNVNTFLAPVIGVNSIGVSARSRAAITPQGILPVAVKRFSAGDTSQPINDKWNPRKGDVIDHLATANSSPLTQADGWPNPLTANPPLPASYRDPDSYNLGGPGPVIPFIGGSALANVANGNDFHFWVAPDVRNITSLTPQYYNGVTASTTVQELKDKESWYFTSVGAYPNVDVPKVGDELGAFSGVNDALTVSALRKRYKRGDVVTAMVYNGTVYRKSDFVLSLSPIAFESPDIRAGDTPARFNLTVTPVNGFVGSVTLSAIAPSTWDSWRFDGGGNDSQVIINLSGASQTIGFTVTSTLPDPTTYPVTGAKTLMIFARSATRLKTIEAPIVIGNGLDGKVFTVSSSEPYKVVSQGSSVDFDVDFSAWNAYNDDVRIEGWSWEGGSGPAYVDVIIDGTAASVRNNRSSTRTVRVVAQPNASTGEYVLKVHAGETNGNNTRDQDLYLHLTVVPQNSGTNVSATTGFVKVLGYANFVITNAGNSPTPTTADNNTVYAYAVSSLKSNPNDLKLGRAPRLIPWR